MVEVCEACLDFMVCPGEVEKKITDSMAQTWSESSFEIRHEATMVLTSPELGKAAMTAPSRGSTSLKALISTSTITTH